VTFKHNNRQQSDYSDTLLAGKFIGNVEVDGTINGIDLVSRMTELEDKVKKLTDFITATNRQPVVDTRIYPTPELTGDNSRLFHGNGFSPGKVRVVITNKDGTYWDDKQALTASGSGFVSTTLLNIPSVNGPFFVAATDERLNPVDWSGLLWSNTVTILT